MKSLAPPLVVAGMPLLLGLKTLLSHECVNQENYNYRFENGLIKGTFCYLILTTQFWLLDDLKWTFDRVFFYIKKYLIIYLMTSASNKSLSTALLRQAPFNDHGQNIQYTIQAYMGPHHRRRIEIENKAKCRRFGLGVKIEWRTRKFWCESVALCT